MKFLRSVKFTIILLVLIVIASIAGSLLEQRTANKLVYHSFWFLGLIASLSLNIILCTVHRLKPLRFKRLGFLLTHLGVIVIIIGALFGALTGESGFIRIFEGDKTNIYFDDSSKPHALPFSIQLEDFIIERYEGNTGIILLEKKSTGESKRYALELDKEIVSFEPNLKFKVLKYIPDFQINLETKEVVTKSENPDNPAIELEINDNGDVSRKWLFAKFHDFHHDSDQSDISFTYFQQTGYVKDYKSILTVIENDQQILTKTIEVNDPLQYKGYAFYQSSYDEKKLSWSGLQVVKDPGLWIVYLGFILLVLGVIFIFYIKPSLKRG